MDIELSGLHWNKFEEEVFGLVGEDMFRDIVVNVKTARVIIVGIFLDLENCSL